MNNTAPIVGRFHQNWWSQRALRATNRTIPPLIGKALVDLTKTPARSLASTLGLIGILDIGRRLYKSFKGDDSFCGSISECLKSFFIPIALVTSSIAAFLASIKLEKADSLNSKEKLKGKLSSPEKLFGNLISKVQDCINQLEAGENANRPLADQLKAMNVYDMNSFTSKFGLLFTQKFGDVVFGEIHSMTDNPKNVLRLLIDENKFIHKDINEDSSIEVFLPENTGSTDTKSIFLNIGELYKNNWIQQTPEKFIELLNSVARIYLQLKSMQPNAIETPAPSNMLRLAR